MYVLFKTEVLKFSCEDLLNMYTLQCLLWNQVVLILTPKYYNIIVINTVSMFVIASILKENTTAVIII